MTDAAAAEKEAMEVTVADLPMEFRVSWSPISGPLFNDLSVVCGVLFGENRRNMLNSC